jgi:hypothetical protein
MGAKDAATEARESAMKVLVTRRMIRRLHARVCVRHRRPLEETISKQCLARHDSVPLPKHSSIESRRADQFALCAYVLLFLLAYVVRTAHAEDVNDAASQNGASQSAPISPEVSKYVDIDAYEGSVRLIHARVIDGTGAALRENQTIEITAGKITAVGPTASTDVADGKTVFDMTGRTLVPGIVGMHDHLFYVARADDNAEHQTNFPTLLPQITYLHVSIWQTASPLSELPARLNPTLN